ncbi:MAG: DUF3127 domain-containing protein [Paludibacteraceae bacterium]|nr:DUF3127 domain-containing protein [Paludibacteraceae bacterium]
MEVVGKIVSVLPEQSGIGKNGNPWKVQPYVLETVEQYPRKVHFEVFGEERIKQYPCEVDQLVTVSFDIESREFNGRWYTSIRAWKIQQGDTTQAAAQPAAAQAQQTAAAQAQPTVAQQTTSTEQPMESLEAANTDQFDPLAGDSTDSLPF